VISREVNGDSVRALVLLARQVNGPIEPVLDSRLVLLASLASGIGIGIVFVIGKFLSRRR